MSASESSADAPTAQEHPSALAENKMERQKNVVLPDSWTVSQWSPMMALLVMMQLRWKFAACVLPVIGLIGAAHYGFKSAGSYDGYTAGSLLSPDRYTDYGTGSVLEQYGYMSADQLNRILGHMRAENLPGFLGWIVFTLATLAVIVMLGMAYDRSATGMAAMLTNDDDMYRFFRDRYEDEFGTYTPSTLDEAVHMPYTIADFSYEWLLRPGAAARWEHAPISEAYRSAIYRQARHLSGRVYLLYNDLWFDAATTTAKRVFGTAKEMLASSGALPVKSSTPPMAQTPVTTNPGTVPAPHSVPMAQTPVANVPMPAPASSARVPASPATAPVSPQPAPAERRFCNQCGARLNPGAAFCGQCGAKQS